jgi:hypothetical protein
MEKEKEAEFFNRKERKERRKDSPWHSSARALRPHFFQRSFSAFFALLSRRVLQFREDFLSADHAAIFVS